MERVAFFDFCETLVDFQTADAFVHFIREKRGDKRMARLNSFVSFLSRTYVLSIIERLFNTPLNKKLVLRQLKGLTVSEIEAYAQSYYDERLKPHQICEVNEKLHQLRNEGYRIVLVSGGYDVYLKVFARNNQISLDDVISSRIQFKNDVCTGRMNGLDCMGNNKIVILNQKFNNNQIDSISFSDSKSDLPLLTWTNAGYVISRNQSQQWAKNNKLNEIIWRT